MRRAFTLIELLVVVGILAMLAAILFPVFAQAKGAAKRTECITNVRQLSAAMLMYLDDHDGTYPVRVDGTDNADVDQWIDMIHPYVRSGPDGKTSPLSKCSEFVPAPGLADGTGRKKITGWGTAPWATSMPAPGGGCARRSPTPPCCRPTTARAPRSAPATGWAARPVPSGAARR